MNALADCRTILAAELPAEARRLRDEGWRFITATAVPRPDAWTVLYHFERAERLCHRRVEIGLAEPVPAIDEAYPAAFLVENEMIELQGLRVTGLSVDYGGRLYRDFDRPEGWVHVHAPGSGETVMPVTAGREAAR
jgi:Respiratory-chain NADH dehydrogenase, 30 Kd subunit